MADPLTPDDSVDSRPGLLAVANDAANQAVSVITSASSRAIIGTKSSATDIVTATDLKSEDAIRSSLQAATPGARMLGEETGHVQLGDGPFGHVEWIVDPLDGTVNFSYGIPVTAVSIAAAIDGSVCAAVVIDGTGTRRFSAVEGGGAFLNDEPITVSNCTELGGAMVATGYAYDAERRQVHARRMADLIGDVRDIRTFGSAALQLCGVASGRLDGYAERHIKPWDWAAGALICSEAGARMEFPCPENDDLVMATTPAIFDGLRRYL